MINSASIEIVLNTLPTLSAIGRYLELVLCRSTLLPNTAAHDKQAMTIYYGPILLLLEVKWLSLPPHVYTISAL